MKSSAIVLGSDPEIFINDGNGNVMPAFDFLPSRYEPAKTEEGEKVYWDGMQCEFTVAPAQNIAKVLQSIRCGLKKTLELARIKDPGAKFSTNTVIDVSLDYLATLPHEFVEFGCAPSFSVYGVSGISKDGASVNVRFAGGHIHLGIGQQAEETMSKIIKALDAILAVTCVSLFSSFDNPVRRQYYGLCGEHRIPEHGCEYRVLSNAWLFNPKVAAMILDLTRKVVAWTFNGHNKWKAEEDEVIETVILCDVNKAREIMKRNFDCFRLMRFTPKVNLLRPIEESVPDMYDIAKNWNL